MASQWFRVRETGSGSAQDPYRPDLKGYDVNGWAGNKTHPQGSPQWIVRVYAAQATLDQLAQEQGVIAYDQVPVSALNAMLGKDWDAKRWRDRFSVQ